MPQRPTRGGGGTGCLVAAGIVGGVGVIVVALVVYGLSAVSSVLGPSTDPTWGMPSGSVSASASARPTVVPTTAPPTTRPASKPTPAAVDPYTRAHPAGTYANDGYDPPIRTVSTAPSPSGLSQAKRWRTSNTLYAWSVATPVRCARDPMRIGEMSLAAQQAAYTAFVGCLMRVWKTPVEKGGDSLPRPPVYMFTGSFSTPCGRISARNLGGLYCSGAVYINGTMDTRYNARGQVTYYGEEMVAHEFGHHVQARTGILAGSWQYQYTLRGAAADVEETRREVQAECLAAMALAATRTSTGLTSDDVSAVIAERRAAAGGLPNHGTADTVERWLKAGFSSARVSSCNTFGAPASQVR